mgnify:CR=1 FL=1
MSSNIYSTGLRNVGSYQASGTPWVTGSESTTYLATDRTVRYSFPYVSKSFTVINTGQNNIRIHFQSGSGATIAEDGLPVNGDPTDDVNGDFHYVTVPAPSGSITMNVKCKEIYISNHSGGDSGYEIFAELTGISTRSMFALTGSGITG